jgi:hypothetical protein
MWKELDFFTNEDVQRGAEALAEYVGEDRFGYEPHARAVLDAVLPAYAKRVRAETLREAADEVRTLAVNGENDGLTWTPGNAETEVYNEAIKDAWVVLRARADAIEGES